MYTTLDYLKKNSACKDGYRQMISFFGRSANMKERKLPLSLCALVLSKNNLHWMINHALIVEPEAFQKFFDKWAVSVLQSTLWENSTIPDKDAAAFEPLFALSKVTTIEQLKPLLEKYRYQSTYGFAALRADHWNNPVEFIRKAVSDQEDEIGHRMKQFRRQNKIVIGDSGETEAEHCFGDYANKHTAYLFSDDPYGEAMQFVIENQTILPGKEKMAMSSSGDKLKATFTLSGNELIFNAYRFVTSKSMAADLQRVLQEADDGEATQEVYEEDEAA